MGLDPTTTRVSPYPAGPSPPLRRCPHPSCLSSLFSESGSLWSSRLLRLSCCRCPLLAQGRGGISHEAALNSLIRDSPGWRRLLAAQIHSGFFCSSSLNFSLSLSKIFQLFPAHMQWRLRRFFRRWQRAPPPPRASLPRTQRRTATADRTCRFLPPLLLPVLLPRGCRVSQSRVLLQVVLGYQEYWVVLDFLARTAMQKTTSKMKYFRRRRRQITAPKEHAGEPRRSCNCIKISKQIPLTSP